MCFITTTKDRSMNFILLHPKLWHIYQSFTSSPQAAVPFAVVGCNTVVEAGGKKIRGRAYPWGIVESKQLASFFFLF